MVTLTITAAAREGGTLHIAIDCVPNYHDLPPGEVRDLVLRMLNAAGADFKLTIDKRKPTRPKLKLTPLEPEPNKFDAFDSF